MKSVSGPGCNGVLIETVDSDVAILALDYAPMLSGPLYMGIGVRGDQRVLNVNETRLTSWELYLPLSPSRRVARRVGFMGLARGGG